jgi:hypothetical protein
MEKGSQVTRQRLKADRKRGEDRAIQDGREEERVMRCSWCMNTHEGKGLR